MREMRAYRTTGRAPDDRRRRETARGVARDSRRRRRRRRRASRCVRRSDASESDADVDARCDDARDGDDDARAVGERDGDGDDEYECEYDDDESSRARDLGADARVGLPSMMNPPRRPSRTSRRRSR